MKTLAALLLWFALLGGLHSAAASEKVSERAWLGGEYKLAKNKSWFQSRDVVAAFPKSESQKAGVFVTAVHSNTPVALGGLRSGDLILQMEGQIVTSLKGFRKLVDSRSPGEMVRLSILREGEASDLSVTLGRETYRRERFLGLGLTLSSQVDLLPDPDFSLIAAGFKRRVQRLELESPETRFVLRTRAENGNGDPGLAREGWHGWLAIVSFGSHKRILSQQLLPESEKLQAVRRGGATAPVAPVGFPPGPVLRGRDGALRRPRAQAARNRETAVGAGTVRSAR